MNVEEHLLVCLAEECAEVIQRATKVLRFGMEEIEPGQTLTNRERLQGEVNDLIAVIELVRLGHSNHAASHRKKTKVLAYMDYAEKIGTLQRVVLP